MIRNCPVTTKDSVRADHINGPDIIVIQGGMKCHINQAIKVQRIPLPIYILLHYKDIKLYIFFIYQRNIFLA